MVQIKVLDLYNSDSLSELSYKDAIKINGGLLADYSATCNTPLISMKLPRKITSFRGTDFMLFPGNFVC